MSTSHRLESALVEALGGGLGALPWRASLGAGAGMGTVAGALGIRARVARDNLALAFPERTPAWRADVLARHYRELGRIVAEYPRLGKLARARTGEVVASVTGMEHLERARAAGRGAILMSGHFGNVELLGAWMGVHHPTAFVVRPLSNPGVESWIARRRDQAGVESIPAGAGVRRVYEALRANRWVAMLADQDARRQGMFVPFFGRAASTAVGPARIALATGAPIVMGKIVRGADGRHTIAVEPPLDPGDDRSDGGEPDAAARLTARHVAVLEGWIRRDPEQWFWLHRRWKTRPPREGAAPVAHPAQEERRASV